MGGYAITPNQLVTPGSLGSAPNYTAVLSDGTLVAMGEATCWDDLRFPFMGQRLDLASGRLDYNYFNGGVDFADNARYPEEPISMLMQCQHAMKFGSNVVVKPHVHWLQAQAAVPNWLLAWKKVRNGQAVTKETDYSNHTLATVSSRIFTYSSGGLGQLSVFPSIDISEFLVSDMIHFVMFRDTANASGEFDGADPISGNVLGWEFDCHVLNNMLGSAEEYAKGA